MTIAKTKTEELGKSLRFILIDYAEDILNSTRCGGLLTLPENIKELVAKNILQAFKDAGGAFVVEDAELPENHLASVGIHTYGKMYYEAQQDMLKEGYRKTEEIKT